MNHQYRQARLQRTVQRRLSIVEESMERGGCVRNRDGVALSSHPHWVRNRPHPSKNPRNLPSRGTPACTPVSVLHKHRPHHLECITPRDLGDSVPPMEKRPGSGLRYRVSGLQASGPNNKFGRSVQLGRPGVFHGGGGTRRGLGGRISNALSSSIYVNIVYRFYNMQQLSPTTSPLGTASPPPTIAVLR